MNVTYNSRQVMYRGNKGFCQAPALSQQRVCEILVCARQAALPSIWMTLMKGEKGNNQRSQYFTLDTDAYSWLLAGEISSPFSSALI